MNKDDMIAAVEAVLFAGGEPVSLVHIARALECEPAEAERALDALKERLDKQKSGVTLCRLDDSYQLATRPEYEPQIRAAFDMRRRTPLSGAALEVLAVIAYNQPVTRAFVEQVRGVDCSGVITTLVEKNLIEECGRMELPGRPLLYGTTKNFLRCFSVSDLSELPPLPNRAVANPDVGEQLPIEDESRPAEPQSDNAEP